MGLCMSKEQKAIEAKHLATQRSIEADRVSPLSSFLCENNIQKHPHKLCSPLLLLLVLFLVATRLIHFGCTVSRRKHA